MQHVQRFTRGNMVREPFFCITTARKCGGLKACCAQYEKERNRAQALVRERMKDWGSGMCLCLGKKLVELTGDYTPDLRALLSADVIIATPEKWDGISRAWQNRGYVQKVCLLIIDEIHLLGADRSAPLLTLPPFMRLFCKWFWAECYEADPDMRSIDAF